MGRRNSSGSITSSGETGASSYPPYYCSLRTTPQDACSSRHEQQQKECAAQMTYRKSRCKLRRRGWVKEVAAAECCLGFWGRRLKVFFFAPYLSNSIFCTGEPQTEEARSTNIIRHAPVSSGTWTGTDRSRPLPSCFRDCPEGLVTCVPQASGVCGDQRTQESGNVETYFTSRLLRDEG